MIIAKAPQLSNCALTYPVPVKIETTLKIIDLRFICVELLIVKYIDNIIILITIILIKV